MENNTVFVCVNWGSTDIRKAYYVCNEKPNCYRISIFTVIFPSSNFNPSCFNELGETFLMKAHNNCKVCFPSVRYQPQKLKLKPMTKDYLMGLRTAVNTQKTTNSRTLNPIIKTIAMSRQGDIIIQKQFHTIILLQNRISYIYIVISSIFQ